MPLLVACTSRAGLAERVECRLQTAQARAPSSIDVAASRGDGHGERTGLDAVGKHRVHGAFEAVGALDA